MPARRRRRPGAPGRARHARGDAGGRIEPPRPPCAASSGPRAAPRSARSRHLAAGGAHLGRARQRHRGPRPRLRRHELRAPGSSERAPARRRPGRAARPRRPTAPPSCSRYLIGFEVERRRSASRSTPATTSGAGTPRRPSARSGAPPPPRASRPRRRADASRARRRRLARLRPQGELRLDDQAVPRGSRRAQRRLRRACSPAKASTASDTALEGRQGYAAAFSRGDAGRRCLRWTRTALAAAGLRHGREALPVVRADPFGDRCPPRAARASRPGRRVRGGHRGRRHRRGARRAAATRARATRSSASSRCSSARRPLWPPGASTWRASRTVRCTTPPPAS